MAPRANWKGFLKIGEVICPVALYTAASTSERIAFHTINRATGHRVHRQFVDSDSGEAVEKENQVKGYEIGKGDYIVLEPEELAAAVPESDKTLSVSSFIRYGDIDDLYFSKPYYLTPTDGHAEEAFILIRDGMRQKKVAAIAQAVLFRRLHTLLIRPCGDGLIATTLHFDYEVKPPGEAFNGIPAMKIKGEMLELAEHIIKTKSGRFDPSKYEDRYEAALAELVKAKVEGRKIALPGKPKPAKGVDLMQALRESAGLAAANGKTAEGRKTAVKSSAGARTAGAKARTAAPRRKAS